MENRRRDSAHDKGPIAALATVRKHPPYLPARGVDCLDIFEATDGDHTVKETGVVGQRLRGRAGQRGLDAVIGETRGFLPWRHTSEARFRPAIGVLSARYRVLT